MAVTFSPFHSIGSKRTLVMALVLFRAAVLARTSDHDWNVPTIRPSDNATLPNGQSPMTNLVSRIDYSSGNQSVRSVENQTGYQRVNPSSTATEENVSQVTLYTETCSGERYTEIVGTRGTIHAMEGDANKLKIPYFCKWSIRVPNGTFLSARFTALERRERCTDRYIVMAGPHSNYRRGVRYVYSCLDEPVRLFTNYTTYYFVFRYRSPERVRIPKFRIDFEAVTEDVRRKMVLEFLSPTSGYIAQYGYDGLAKHLCFMDASYELRVPERHAVMLSVSRLHLIRHLSRCPLAGLWLYRARPDGGRSLVFHKCGTFIVPADVFHTTSLLFHFKTSHNCHGGGTGFKAVFTFHPEPGVPQKLGDGLFNCSTPDYGAFRIHLHCNLEPECARGEDEGAHCPFSGQSCPGPLQSGHKCFSYINWNKPISGYAAQTECRKLGGDLAMMKTDSEWDDLQNVFRFGKRLTAALVGLRTGDYTFPPVYKNMMKWVDGSIVQNSLREDYRPMYVSYNRLNERCGVVDFNGGLVEIASYERCIENQRNHNFFICQFVTSARNSSGVVFPTTSFAFAKAIVRRLWLLPCLEGHVTHSFLSCDPESRCQILKGTPHASCSVTDKDGNELTTAMFECDDGSATLPYSLVCDFRHDCSDRTDESFCVHPQRCDGFRCRNSQCIEKEKLCDIDQDCLDGSDEFHCMDTIRRTEYAYRFPRVFRHPPPVSIDFGPGRTLVQVSLNHSQPCADTHFRCCSGHYCLPVYLLCNGVADCNGKEDERDCRLYRCPGFYRCRSSTVCLHADHLCDGWPQCPQHDDELLCDAECPDGCRCQGHAFVCPYPFPVTSFPQLRYLDAEDSNMAPRDLSVLSYLVWLSLSRCRLRQMSRVGLPNLKHLDLSRNRLDSLDIDQFRLLKNLKVLILAHNPVSFIVQSGTTQTLSSITSLDLSWSSLRQLTGELLGMFKNLTHLNLSHSRLDYLFTDSLGNATHLTHLDLRANPLYHYPKDVLKKTKTLRSLLTDDFRLCCRASLPDAFPDGSCVAREDPLSSCGDLISDDLHRALWVTGMVLAVAGNLACLALSAYNHRKDGSSPFKVITANLATVDLTAGLYSAVIVTTDFIFRGRYISSLSDWTSSLVCKLAGAVAMTTYTASSLLVCLLALHNLTALYSDRKKSTPLLSSKSALAACSLAWTFSLALASVPLLPALSHWHSFAQTSACLPFSGDFPGRSFTLATTAVLPLTVSLVTLSAHCFAYGLVKSDFTLAVRKQRAVTEARRVALIVVTDLLRRVAAGALGMVRQADASIGDGVHVPLAVLLLLATSALNPLLYAAGIVLDRRRQKAESRLLQQLYRRIASGLKERNARRD